MRKLLALGVVSLALLASCQKKPAEAPPAEQPAQPPAEQPAQPPAQPPAGQPAQPPAEQPAQPPAGQQK